MRPFRLFVQLSVVASLACAGSPPAAVHEVPPPVAQVTTAPVAGPEDPFGYDAGRPLDVQKGEVVAGRPVRVQAISYASPRVGRVPALWIAPADDAKHPAVLFQHRGIGDKTQFQDEAEELAKLGIASLSIDGPQARSEYRGKTFETHWAELVRHGAVDALRGIDVLASLPGVDAERIAFVGHSYGAHLGAILLARSPRVKAAVLMAPMPSVSRYAKNPALAPIDPERFIKESHVPVFEQFGVRDDKISAKDADGYFEITPAPSVARVYEADHGMNVDVARRDRREFLQQVFSPPELAKVPGFFMTRLPVAYAVPPESSFQRLPEQTYRTVAGQDYRLDVYRPAQATGARPAVIFVHGQMHPALVRDAKGWRSYQESAEILAAKGYVSVLPNLGASATGYGPTKLFSEVTPVADNLEAAVRYVRTHAAKLGVDPSRIALWVASAGGAYGLGSALGNLAPITRAVVAYYPFITESVLTGTEPPLPAATIERLSAVRQLRRRGAKIPSVLLVRAAYDGDELNRGIDEFVKVAAESKAPVTLVRHEHGHHAFEIRDATDETRAVLEKTFAFLEEKLQKR